MATLGMKALCPFAGRAPRAPDGVRDVFDGEALAAHVSHSGDVLCGEFHRTFSLHAGGAWGVILPVSREVFKLAEPVFYLFGSHLEIVPNQALQRTPCLLLIQKLPNYSRLTLLLVDANIA